MYGNILCDRPQSRCIRSVKSSSMDWNWILALQTNSQEREVGQTVWKNLDEQVWLYERSNSKC